MHVGQRGVLRHEHLHRTGKTRQAARQNVGQELVLVGLVAERDGALLVLADRFEDFAERRVDSPVNQQEAEQEDRQDHVIERRRLRQVEDAEHHALRNALDAVFAVGEGRLKVDEKQQLRQRQRDHREVDALPADGDQSGDDAQPA